jgi:SET and MYND domain-containing protein
MDVNHTYLIQTPGAGNGLASISDLPSGSLILQTRSPDILVVETPKIDKFCSYCFLPLGGAGAVPKRCTRCKVIRYCSTECQRADWKLIHQKECPVLRDMPGVPPTPVRALIQILLLGSTHDDRWKGLEAHVEKFSAGKKGWEDIRLQAGFAVSHSKSPPTRLILAIRTFCRVCHYTHFEYSPYIFSSLD